MGIRILTLFYIVISLFTGFSREIKGINFVAFISLECSIHICNFSEQGPGFLTNPPDLHIKVMIMEVIQFDSKNSHNWEEQNVGS